VGARAADRRAEQIQRYYRAYHDSVTETRILTGGCECGAVAYRVPDEFEYAMNCHCSRCRAGTGSAFKSVAGIKRKKLEIVNGADKLLAWPEPERGHIRCAVCGGFLYSVVRRGEYAHVGLGTLADEPTIRPSCHIYVGSKAPWFEITDDLPQYDELPD
jgi:hypothetical protein